MVACLRPACGRPRASPRLGGFDASRSRAVFILSPDTGGPWQTWEWTGSAWEHGTDVPPLAPDAMVFDTWRNRGFLYGTGGSDEQSHEHVPRPDGGTGDLEPGWSGHSSHGGCCGYRT